MPSKHLRSFFSVSKMRLELTQPTGHYPLKVARLPIPPPGHLLRVGAKNGTRTRDPDLGKVVLYQLSYFREHLKNQVFVYWSEKRDSNPRPRPWQGRALPTELFSRFFALRSSLASLLRVQSYNLFLFCANFSGKNFKIYFSLTLTY